MAVIQQAPSFNQQQAAIEQRRQLAQLLHQQSSQLANDPNAMVSGRVVPVSPLTALLKGVENGFASYNMTKANSEQARLEDQKQQQLAAYLNKHEGAPMGDLAGVFDNDTLAKLLLRKQIASTQEGDGYHPPIPIVIGGKPALAEYKKGAWNPLMINGEQVSIPTQDQGVQGGITQAREAAKGVKMQDEQGRDYYAPQGAVNPAFNNPFLALQRTESTFDPNAVSPAGAFGPAQIMPATAKKPGGNVMPMRNNSIKEQLRFAHDYQQYLIDQRLKQGHSEQDAYRLSLQDYNQGAKRVDANPNNGREYADRVMGHVANPLQGVNLGGIVKGPSPNDLAIAKEQALAPIKTEQAVNEAQAKAQIDVGKEQAIDQMKARQNLPLMLNNLKETAQVIDEFINSPGFSGLVGIPNGLDMVPATKELAAKKMLKQIEGKQFASIVQMMKGSGLGALSDIEGGKLQEAAGRLSRFQSEDDMRKSLQEIKDSLGRIKQAMMEKAGVQMQQAPQTDNRDARLQALRAKHPDLYQ